MSYVIPKFIFHSLSSNAAKTFRDRQQKYFHQKYEYNALSAQQTFSNEKERSNTMHVHAQLFLGAVIQCLYRISTTY